jgi:hypothetical protein
LKFINILMSPSLLADQTRNGVDENWQARVCMHESFLSSYSPFKITRTRVARELMRIECILPRVYSENSCQLLKLMRVDDESCMAAILYNSGNQAKIASCVFFAGLKLANSSPSNVWINEITCLKKLSCKPQMANISGQDESKQTRFESFRWHESSYFTCFTTKQGKITMVSVPSEFGVFLMPYKAEFDVKRG